MAGAKNSALFAAEILAIKDEKGRGAVEEYRRKLREGYGQRIVGVPYHLDDTEVGNQAIENPARGSILRFRTNLYLIAGTDRLRR